MESINDRIKDLRFQYDAEHISQEDLANALGIPNSTISDYEKPGTYIPHEVILRYCEHFSVSADFLLGRTGIRNLPKAELHELHLTDKAMEKLKSLPKEECSNLKRSKTGSRKARKNGRTSCRSKNLYHVFPKD